MPLIDARISGALFNLRTNGVRIKKNLTKYETYQIKKKTRFSQLQEQLTINFKCFMQLDIL